MRTLTRIPVLLLILFSAVAQAHKSSDSYLRLSPAEVERSRWDGQWDIALRDLDVVLGLDANSDGNLTWGEVRRRQADIAAYALSRLTLRVDGAVCGLQPAGMQIDHHSDGAYAVLQFAAACAAVAQALELDYRLFANVDAGHRGLINLALGGVARTAVLGPGQPQARFEREHNRGWRQFADYLRTGIDHIWTGYDHLLFLFSLLLPAVLFRTGRQWLPHGSLPPAFTEVCKIVTAFTFAHSVTLSLASFGILRLPARLSESAIALSVVLAALNNVVPIVRSRRWVVAFCFGLVHGFGFANVLLDLGLTGGTTAIALLGFNLGVEAGQLAIIAVFMPIAFWLRATLLYRRVLVTGGSLAIATIGALWLIERSFDLQFLPVH